MKTVKNPSDFHDSNKRKYLSKSILAVVLFIGIFSFLYWFILCPLVWSNLPSKGWPPYWFNIYCLIAFLIWSIIVALALLLLWHYRDKIVPVYRDSNRSLIVSRSKLYNDDDDDNDDVPYLTELIRVQPDEKDMKVERKESLVGLNEVSDKNLENLLTIIIPNETPETLLTNQKDINVQCSLPVKETSRTNDGRTSNGKQPDQSNYQADPADSGTKPKVIMRKKKPANIENIPDTSDATTSDQNDLSPREVFFFDLIKQAEEEEKKTGRKRIKSEKFSDVPADTAFHSAKSRRSIPLYLYINPYGNHTDEAPTEPDQEKSLLTKEYCDPTLDPEDLKEDDTVRRATNRDSLGEYFIADVASRKSIRSEVHLFVSDDSSPVSPIIQSDFHLFKKNINDQRPVEEYFKRDEVRKKEGNDMNSKEVGDDSVFY